MASQVDGEAAPALALAHQARPFFHRCVDIIVFIFLTDVRTYIMIPAPRPREDVYTVGAADSAEPGRKEEGGRKVVRGEKRTVGSKDCIRDGRNSTFSRAIFFSRRPENKSKS